jgi:mRNA-degrading endonuclease RelE of RelBE toxin-antitoxin system
MRAIPKTDLRCNTDRLRGLQSSSSGLRKDSAGHDHYRIRQRDYCIVYAIDDDTRMVTFVKVGHRRDVYCLELPSAAEYRDCNLRSLNFKYVDRALTSFV